MAAVLLMAPGAAQSAARRPRIPPPQCPTLGTRAVTPAGALDGGSFRAAGGEEILLAGIVAAGKDGESLAPDRAEAARRALAEALAAGPVTLAPAAAPDRYGRMRAQVFAGGQWLQGLLLRAGLARAAPDAASTVCADTLLRAEAAARTAKSGHWGDGVFVLRTPENVETHAGGVQPGSFQIVEGVVARADIVKGRAFLNFGADYKKDFTITVAPADMRAFRVLKRHWGALAGRRVRVRGWIDFYNGPEIEIANPAALEWLDPVAPQ